MSSRPSAHAFCMSFTLHSFGWRIHSTQLWNVWKKRNIKFPPSIIDRFSQSDELYFSSQGFLMERQFERVSGRPLLLAHWCRSDGETHSPDFQPSSIALEKRERDNTTSSRKYLCLLLWRQYKAERDRNQFEAQSWVSSPPTDTRQRLCHFHWLEMSCINPDRCKMRILKMKKSERQRGTWLNHIL